MSEASEKITELQREGFCVLGGQLSRQSSQACKDAFWPILLAYIHAHRDTPNRGPQRHFLPMPFDPPCFAPELFFDPLVIEIVRGAMDHWAVADQWGCDVPVQGSQFQEAHLDYRRPLFPEAAELALPAYMLVVSFGLIEITDAHGPLEIAPGTHRMPREEAIRAVQSGHIAKRALPLALGDVLIRHPWALHRGTPNRTGTPRALVTIRYVRRWYADESREISAIPAAVWQSLTADQRSMMRFPVLP